MTALDSGLRERLAAELGAGTVTDDGVVIPPDVAGVAAVARLCSSAGVRMRVRSSAAGAADADGGAAVTLNLNRLTAVTVAAASLSARAEAGATLAAVRAALQRQRLAVVGLGPSGRSEHVGTLVARGEVPRRALCGVEVVLAGGERVSTGAGVLKDVVGYDLPALLLGSMGRLAIIVAVTFRLEPENAATAVAPPPGAAAAGSEAVVEAAFDPQGLLQPRG